MQPPSRQTISFRLRILPGRIIRIRPHRIKRLGWKCGDSLVWIPHGQQALIFRKQTEREWRIERSQLRGRRVPLSQWPIRCPRTLADWLRLGDERYASDELFTGIGQITQVGGNNFLDLAFPPDESDRLKEESDRSISHKKHGLRAEVSEHGGVFVARCLDIDVASDGATEEDAVAALKEALELYFEDSTNLSCEKTGA